MVADMEYPARVAFALLNKMMDQYDKEHAGQWQMITNGPKEWPPLVQAIKDYQDPTKADKISSIQKDLDETTAVLVCRMGLIKSSFYTYRRKRLIMCWNEGKNWMI